MSTATAIIPQDRRRAAEHADLSLEIFATTYGADWNDADALADAQLPSLLEYAAKWDAAILLAGNLTAQCPF